MTDTAFLPSIDPTDTDRRSSIVDLQYESHKRDDISIPGNSVLSDSHDNRRVKEKEGPLPKKYVLKGASASQRIVASHSSTRGPRSRATTQEGGSKPSGKLPAVDCSDDPFSYRHYCAYHPTSNKLLSKKWEERSRSIHLKKLQDVRATIDNVPPKIYPHLEIRLKKLKLDEDRLVDIERKNQILLERIEFQMMKMSDSERKGQPQPAIKSFINNDKRRRDNALIAAQNVEICKRIESKTPFYSRLDWLADRRRSLGYLKNISQYPKHYFRLSHKCHPSNDMPELNSKLDYPNSPLAQATLQETLPMEQSDESDKESPRVSHG
ncbi:hypothetical protein BSLG_008050 [Batrachochytrium salamandrivorans]|nr:hypothetical protein BSLG_008050 [Batrachochytrium salamandrivorans]